MFQTLVLRQEPWKSTYVDEPVEDLKSVGQ